MVGARGFEPPTPWSQTRCANQTALRPDKHLLTQKVDGIILYIFSFVKAFFKKNQKLYKFYFSSLVLLQIYSI